MIAKITDANQEYYAPRFAYITAELDKHADLPSIVIDSLESYYANIEYIKQLYSREDGSNAGYLLLTSPADEEYFAIDANARTIAVPASFKKYGVGVYGDHLAEMLVFKIDRYFDYQDLYETKIAINWNFTPAGSRTPLYEEVQSDEALFPNDVLEPGFITFGFVVTKEMTKGKGVLNLSVTFYNEDGGEVSYSLNTQTISVNINDGFTLENPQQVRSVASDLLNRLRNSAYTPDGLEPLATPKWLTGEKDGENYLGLFNELNFNMDDNAVEPDFIVLEARAHSEGHLGNMNYTWSANQGDIGERAMGVLGEVAKLKTAPNDANKLLSQSNQNGIIVDQNYNEIIVHGNLASLNEYASTNPSQGSGKWVGIDIGTRADSIVGIKWNGSVLTEDDVAESASVGLAANHIIFWAKAEALLESEREIVLSADDFDDVTLRVRFVDNSGLSSPSNYIAITNAEDIFEEHVYYIKNNLGVIDKTNPLNAEQALEQFGEGVEIFELGSSYKAFGAGSYQVKAQATKLITNNNVNYISVNSELAESNVCVIPSAAKPAVTLEVASSFELPEGCIIENQVVDAESGIEYTYIAPNAAPAITATVVSTESGKDLGAVALEILKEADIADLTTEDIEAGNYEFNKVAAPSYVFNMNENDAIEEGEYKVRAINYKNHTYNVSEPSDTIVTAFVAPAISNIDVTYAYANNGEIMNVPIITAGESVPLGQLPYTTITLDNYHPVFTFTIEDASENLEGAVVSYFVEELENRSGEFVPMGNSDSDPGWELLEVVLDGNNELKFQIGNEDSGYFRIKTENRYKGTMQVAYTGVFMVSKL